MVRNNRPLTGAREVKREKVRMIKNEILSQSVERKTIQNEINEIKTFMSSKLMSNMARVIIKNKKVKKSE